MQIVRGELVKAVWYLSSLASQSVSKCKLRIKPGITCLCLLFSSFCQLIALLSLHLDRMKSAYAFETFGEPTTMLPSAGTAIQKK